MVKIMRVCVCVCEFAEPSKLNLKSKKNKKKVVSMSKMTQQMINWKLKSKNQRKMKINYK